VVVVDVVPVVVLLPVVEGELMVDGDCDDGFVVPFGVVLMSD
jgi:hypothetical protein